MIILNKSTIHSIRDRSRLIERESYLKWRKAAQNRCRDISFIICSRKPDNTTRIDRYLYEFIGKMRCGIFLEKCVECSKWVISLIASRFIDLIDHHDGIDIVMVKRVWNTFPGRAPFHWLLAPESTHPAVVEPIGINQKPVPSNSATFRPKWVLPIPGGPKRSIGSSSSGSFVSRTSTSRRLISRITSEKFGTSSSSSSRRGIRVGFTSNLVGHSSIMRS